MFHEAVLLYDQCGCFTDGYLSFWTVFGERCYASKLAPSTHPQLTNKCRRRGVIPSVAIDVVFEALAVRRDQKTVKKPEKPAAWSGDYCGVVPAVSQHH